MLHLVTALVAFAPSARHAPQVARRPMAYMCAITSSTNDKLTALEQWLETKDMDALRVEAAELPGFGQCLVAGKDGCKALAKRDVDIRWETICTGHLATRHFAYGLQDVLVAENAVDAKRIHRRRREAARATKQLLASCPHGGVGGIVWDGEAS